MSVRPNFFILGAPKCGTTSLAKYCALNPEIYVPAVKEIGFFNNPERYALGDAYLKEHYINGSKTIWRCDGTPTYFASHRVVIPALVHFYADPRKLKFVVILRDPIDRFISHYLHNFHRRSETRDINEVAISELELIRQGAGIEELEYLGPGFYDRLMTAWLNHFDASQFLVLSSQLLSESRHTELAKLWEFLGVPEIEHVTQIERNISGIPRSDWVQRWVSEESSVGKRLIRRLAPERWRSQLRQYITELNTSKKLRKQIIRDDIMEQLTDIYNGPITTMSKFINSQS
jgi:hypothetical protein